MRNLKELEKFRMREQEKKYYGMYGDEWNGCFKVFAAGRSFFVIVSNGGGWDHVSVTPCSEKRKTCPTWEEMCKIKDMFFDPEEIVVQYHPPKSRYVNRHPYCLHLWRPNNGESIITPPTEFV